MTNATNDTTKNYSDMTADEKRAEVKRLTNCLSGTSKVAAYNMAVTMVYGW